MATATICDPSYWWEPWVDKFCRWKTVNEVERRGVKNLSITYKLDIFSHHSKSSLRGTHSISQSTLATRSKRLFPVKRSRCRRANLALPFFTRSFAAGWWRKSTWTIIEWHRIPQRLNGVRVEDEKERSKGEMRILATISRIFIWPLLSKILGVPTNYQVLELRRDKEGTRRVVLVVVGAASRPTVLNDTLYLVQYSDTIGLLTVASSSSTHCRIRSCSSYR